AGSLGVDVETTVDTFLKDTSVVLIPTNAKGPLCSDQLSVGGLLLGHSSTSRSGVIVLPGVINADYTGIIQVMAYTLHPPTFIPKGSRIAQIVALINLSSNDSKNLTTRGEKGFGSTGPAVLFTQKLFERPRIPVSLTCGDQTVVLHPILDTGADVTIIN
ncbi:POK9 protein, partial [Corythaeola cristata]|nr:POK9 protein [Corythaeola cristata]